MRYNIMVPTHKGAEPLFGRKSKAAGPAFDPAGKRPVVRSSICTGERVAGWRDADTGRFAEVMLLRSDEDLRRFLADYGFRQEDLRYEW